MWLFDKISKVSSWVKDKLENAVDWVKGRLGGTTYKRGNMEDHVNVDRVLADFRKSIDSDVREVENKCMENISEIFMDLKDRTSERFPDLVEIISVEQKKAEKELSGTVMRYVKEHLSKNDAKFFKILEMAPGSAKEKALGAYAKGVINDAEKTFNLKLSKYAKNLLNEFNGRLKGRMCDQELQYENQIEELKHLREQAEKGKIDVEVIRDKSAIVMETAACILSILETEI